MAKRTSPNGAPTGVKVKAQQGPQAKPKQTISKASRNTAKPKPKNPKGSSRTAPQATPASTDSTQHDRDQNLQEEEASSVASVDIPIVGIGASAGGLEALEDFFRSMTSDSGAGFVVIVHLSPDFKSLMPELIAKQTSMPVLSPTHGTVIQPNHVYIIPPAKNMKLNGRIIILESQDRSPGHSLNLPIDLFFESLGMECRDQGTAIILSGTGSDGSRGIRTVKEYGGLVMVQQPESAKFGGMPTVAVETRLADVVAPAEKLASSLLAYFQNAKLPIIESQKSLNEDLHMLLKQASGLDLSYYRAPVVERRVKRRMGLSGFIDSTDYWKFISRNPDEARQLVKDLLIGVTNFFRDAHVFDYLQDEILPQLLLEKPLTEDFRIWVPACSTGEEVYSLAILMMEVNQVLKQERPFTIFATDIDHESVNKASNGEYPLSLLADISPNRLGKYFMQNGDSYIVNPEVRKHIRFAQHNLVEDTPFSRIDLVSCRNFLIYVNPSKQERVISALHFCLKKSGVMLLGPAESIVGFEGALEPISPKQKLFRKVGAVAHKHIHWSHSPIDPITAEASTRLSSTAINLSAARDPTKALFHMLLNLNQQSVILLTMSGDMVELYEDVHQLFHIPKGKLTNNLSKLIVPELHAPLLAGLHRLRKGEDVVLYQLEYNQRYLQFQLARIPENPEQALLVIEDTQKTTSSSPNPVEASSLTWDMKANDVIHGLETELQHTKENLQAMIEELQTTNEEQQSTNEELVASNEELQSTNEELQSVNEELYTVNQEFNNKNQELSVLTQDLENLIRATNIGTLYLDRTLTIRKFTPAVIEIIPILNTDIGRPLKDLVHGLNHDVFVDIQTVLETGMPLEREVRDKHGAWILMRCHPYLTKGAMEDGILVTFVNVTTLKNAQEFSMVVNQKLEEANRTLIEQSEELEDLFSILAHDLKRPVISLDGLLTLVEQSVDWPAEHTSRSHLLKALEECRRMQRLLQDVTQVSGKARQQAVYETIELQPFIDNIIDRFSEQARAGGIRMNVSCDSSVQLLPKAVLEQVLHNLIENAMKYGTSNEKPRIDVSCHLQGNHLQLTVNDNGKGISPGDHAKVFELFRRLEPNESEGSGIGLVAIRRQISKVGGHVDLESSLGHGAKFSVSIPISRVPNQISTQERYQILLVEDDALDKKILQRCLEEMDPHLATPECLFWARNISEARDILQANPIDLILLDLSLPDGHGFNFLSELRALTEKIIPVVILSGQAEGIPFTNLKDEHMRYLSKSELSTESLRLRLNEVLLGSTSVER